MRRIPEGTLVEPVLTALVTTAGSESLLERAFAEAVERVDEGDDTTRRLLDAAYEQFSRMGIRRSPMEDFVRFLLIPSMISDGGRTLATVQRFVAGQLRREQHAGNVSGEVDVELVAEMMTRVSTAFLVSPSRVVSRRRGTTARRRPAGPRAHAGTAPAVPTNPSERHPTR
jgi:hypothetical protein